MFLYYKNKFQIELTKNSNSPKNNLNAGMYLLNDVFLYCIQC